MWATSAKTRSEDLCHHHTKRRLGLHQPGTSQLQATTFLVWHQVLSLQIYKVKVNKRKENFITGNLLAFLNPTWVSSMQKYSCMSGLMRVAKNISQLPSLTHIPSFVEELSCLYPWQPNQFSCILQSNSPFIKSFPRFMVINHGLVWCNVWVHSQR